MTELEDQRAERLARLRERRAEPSLAGASLPTHPSATGVTGEMPVAPTTPGRSPRRTSPAATAKIVTVGASTTAVLGLVAGYGFADRVATADQVVSPGTAIAASADESAGAPDPRAAALAPPAAAGQPVTAPPPIIVVVIDGTTGRPITTVDESLDKTVRTQPTSTQAAPAATTVPAPQPPAPAVAIDLAVPAPPAPQPAPAAPAPAPAPVQATTGGS